MKKELNMDFLRIGLLFLVLNLFSCQSKGQGNTKINGLSFVASSLEMNESEIDILKEVHPNYVALMPYGFSKALNSPNLYFDNPRQWWGEKSEGVAETIRMCHAKKIEVMLKPQIWIGGGDFTGFMEMKSEADWITFEEDYSKFILTFAKLAEKEKVALFCIGTEMGKFVAERPKFWEELVQQVRILYSGKITYAENWDCFDKPAFLKDLDFVGVDAYFPLSDEKDPTLEQIRAGWEAHLPKLAECYAKYQKPILFTECGYRSVDYAASKPWEFDHKDAGVNQALQVRLTEVMFELWKEEWMAGGFIWKWFPFHEKAGGETDTQFTPQNKLAEKTIKNFFKIESSR